MSAPRPPAKAWWEYLLEALIGMKIKGDLQAIAGPGAISGSATTHMDLPTFYKTPHRPPFTTHETPNFTYAPGRKVTLVVIHATATPGISSPLAWLCDPSAKASAHYLIGLDGTTYRLVHEQDVSWHAGESRWRSMEYVNPKTGKPTVNNCSIGIELVNPNDGYTPYPEAQLAVCAQLVRAICEEYSVGLEDVVGHADVAPGRKNDPLGFDWHGFRARLR